MKSIRLVLLLSGVFLAALVAACSHKERANHFKVGVIAGPEEQVAEVARQVAKERYGLDVELVPFSDYITPNAALADGSIDVNAFQHRPFLDQQVKDRGYRLAVVGRTFVYPLAAYSRQIRKLNDLADGSQVAVPNDPTNLGRSLVLLEKQGLLRLRSGAGLLATVLDIAENPKRLRVVELEAPQLPRALPDVAFAIINTTYASQAGLSPTRDGLFVENRDSPYVNLIVARVENRDAKNVRDFVRTYQSEEVYAAALKIFDGGVVKGW